jgi:hypothetical protein
MKREEHTELIQKIRTALPAGADLSVVTEALTTLSDDYGTVVAELDTTKTNVSQMTKDLESLRETNMRLFLKVGSPTPDIDKKADPEDTRLKFEDLFNEKGGLK